MEKEGEDWQLKIVTEVRLAGPGLHAWKRTETEWIPVSETVAKSLIEREGFKKEETSQIGIEKSETKSTPTPKSESSCSHENSWPP